MYIYVVMKNVETFDAYENECDGTRAVGAFKTLELANLHLKHFALDEYDLLNGAHKEVEIIFNEPKGGRGTVEVEWNDKNGYEFRKYSWWVQMVELSEDMGIPKVCKAHDGIVCECATIDCALGIYKCTYAKECPFAKEMAN